MQKITSRDVNDCVYIHSIPQWPVYHSGRENNTLEKDKLFSGIDKVTSASNVIDIVL